MANSTIRSCNPYHWQYRASRRYQKVYIALHLGVAALSSYVLAVSLRGPGVWLVFAVLLIAMHAVWGIKRQAGFGAVPLELSLNSAGELQRLEKQGDATRLAASLEVLSCRWFGASFLVATLRPKELPTWAKLLGVNNQHLVLWSDNSTAEDRHRLAMFYHSGPAE